jgi:hypothetical protein
MTFPSLANALERLAPPQHFADDWDDVLARAGEPDSGDRPRAFQRRRWLLAAAFAAAIVIPIAAATVAARNDWWFLASHGPKPLTAPVVVKSGSWDGKSWELVAYRSASDGICFTVTPSASATSDGLGAALACGGFSIAAPSGSSERTRGITYMSSSSPELPTYVAGPVIDTADHVVIYFANGDVVRTPAFDAPASLGAIRFYAAQISEPVVRPTGGRRQSSLQKLVGLDNEGRIVACLTLSATSRC